jgi:methylenetetrahydrofolate reductase (NADPH)
MIQPTVRSILAARTGPTLSLEFYPPKSPLGFGVLGASIERMRAVRPDFATCTYGAGGSTRDNSFAACELLARMGFTPVVAHLTCVGATRAQLEEQIHRIHAAGIRNVMALRGDPPRGDTAFRPPEGGLAHASDLVALVKSLHSDICCGVAGYPETHPESPSRADDIRWLKRKIDAGADFVNTQLFYDNRAYFDFVRDCRDAGIAVPILPGLMPVADRGQLERSVAFSRAAVPAALADALDRAPDDASRRAAGMRWTVDQIDGLIDGGAPGVHLYILNQANTVLDPALSACLRRWRSPVP